MMRLDAEDLLTPDHLADPYPLLERLRTDDPVHWNSTMGALDDFALRRRA